MEGGSQTAGPFRPKLQLTLFRIHPIVYRDLSGASTRNANASLSFVTTKCHPQLHYYSASHARALQRSSWFSFLVQFPDISTHLYRSLPPIDLCSSALIKQDLLIKYLESARVYMTKGFALSTLKTYDFAIHINTVCTFLCYHIDVWHFISYIHGLGAGIQFNTFFMTLLYPVYIPFRQLNYQHCPFKSKIYETLISVSHAYNWWWFTILTAHWLC